MFLFIYSIFRSRLLLSIPLFFFLDRIEIETLVLLLLLQFQGYVTLDWIGCLFITLRGEID